MEAIDTATPAHIEAAMAVALAEEVCPGRLCMRHTVMGSTQDRPPPPRAPPRPAPPRPAPPRSNAGAREAQHGSL